MKRFEQKAVQCTDGFVPSLDLLMTSYSRGVVPNDVVQVRVGNDLAEEGGSVHTVLKIIVHEGYSDLSAVDDNDLALLKIDPPFEFTRRVQQVELVPPDREPVEGQYAWVTGFGYQQIMSRRVLKEHFFS